jgi:hypothetical protein
MSRQPQVLLISLLVVAAARESRALTGQSPAQSAASSSASAAAAIPEVTVQAQRDLASKVAKFVNQIAVPENGDEGGLALWDTPVCPLVSGLPGTEGEFILERISEIARAAQVPLAGEYGRPNLYILVTLHPEDLLRKLEKHDRVRRTGTWTMEVCVEGSSEVLPVSHAYQHQFRGM